MSITGPWEAVGAGSETRSFGYRFVYVFHAKKQTRRYPMVMAPPLSIEESSGPRTKVPQGHLGMQGGTVHTVSG